VPSPSGGSAPSGSAVVAALRKLLGDPYVYGAEGPKEFDCSGLVQYVFQGLGVKNVPRTSSEQWRWVTKISYAQLQPGDLVFSQWPGDGDPQPGHVAVYVGDGQIIEAPHTGESVHQVPLDSGYRKFVTGYGRIPGASGGAAGGSAGAATGTLGSTAGAVDAGKVNWANPFSILGNIGGSITSDLGSALMIAFQPIILVAKEFYNGFVVAMHAVVWLVNPANWVRIIIGIVGTAALIGGLVFLAKAQ